MAIHSPNIFHNTIASASIHGTEGTPFDDMTRYQRLIIETSDWENSITPKNITTDLSTPKLIAQWNGDYFITWNATATNGLGAVFTVFPYKNGVVLNYGNIKFTQQSIGASIVPYYEVSTSFIVRLVKDDYINFYCALYSATYPSTDKLQFDNIQMSMYQLEQVGVH